MKPIVLPQQGGRKRIFLGLLTASCIVVSLFLAVFLIMPWAGWGVRFLAPISVTVGLIGILFLAWMGLTLVFHIYTGRWAPGIGFARYVCTKLFLPLMELVGRCAGLDKNIVRRSFLKVNNEFVRSNAAPTSPERLLLLLPHCMQNSDCHIRLHGNLGRCAACGGCQLGQIRKLSERYGFHAVIATGGTIARRQVAAIRPRRIIAIACERDLATGIQDCYPIPVYGILNERPQGPCRDTLVQMANLESALNFFLDKKL